MKKRILCIFAALLLCLEPLQAAALGTEPTDCLTIHTPVLTDGKAPTETEPGYTGDLVCGECGAMLVPGVEIPKLDLRDTCTWPEHFVHTPVLENSRTPTLTQEGYTGDIVCSECGEILLSGKVLPPAAPDPSGIHIVHLPKLIHTVEPTYLDPGYTGDIVCAECGLLLCQGVPMEAIGMHSHRWPNPFDDVKPLDYYYKSVLWAYYGGITKGTTENLFSPQSDCTRAHAVTFLWRTMGSPEPTIAENPFRDVEQSQYYYKAVLWAYEKGITLGTTAETFDPYASCSRGQIVTFLWRMQGSESVRSGACGFSDVAEGQYYTEAVQWAASEGIVLGYSDGTFRPHRICIRGEIVTFLYRAYTQ